MDKESVERKNYYCNALKLREFQLTVNDLQEPFIQFLLAFLDYELLRKLSQENIKELQTLAPTLQEMAKFGSIILNHIIDRLIQMPKSKWKNLLSRTTRFFKIAEDNGANLPPHLLLIFDLALLENSYTEPLLHNWAKENRLILALSYYFGLKIGDREFSLLQEFEGKIKSDKQLEKFLGTLLIWQELMEGSDYEKSKQFLDWLRDSGEKIYRQFSKKLMLDDSQSNSYEDHCEEWDLETLPDLWYAFNVMDETHRALMKDFVASNHVNFQLPQLTGYDAHLTQEMSNADVDVSRFKRNSTETFVLASQANQRAEALDQIVNTLNEIISKLPKGQIFDLNEKLFSRVGVENVKNKRLSIWTQQFSNENPDFFVRIKEACDQILDELFSLLPQLPGLPQKRANMINKLKHFDTRFFTLQIWDRIPSSCLPLGRFANSCISLDRPQKSAILDYLADRSVEIFRLVETTQDNRIVREWGYSRMVLGWVSLPEKNELCVLIDSIELAIDKKEELSSARQSILSMAKKFAASIGAKSILISPRLNLTNNGNAQKIKFTKMGGCLFDQIYLHSFYADGTGWIQKSTSGEVAETSDFCVVDVLSA